METEDITAALVSSIIKTRFEDLPPEAVEATKLHFLHSFAITIAGSSQPGCDIIVEQVSELCGKPESTILVFGNKVPAPLAAMANASMSHALEFDHNDDRTAYKSSVCAIPAAVAVGERLGIPGKDVLTAACLAIDLGIRISLAINPKPGHPGAAMLGPFCAAAAAGKLLGLDEECMLNALGIAYCSVATTGTGVTSPSLSKRLGPGLSAEAGVTAALLAQKGFPAGHRILQGERGFYRRFFHEEGDLERLTRDLGRTFEVVNVGPKPYPSCRYTHAAVDAALDLVTRCDLQPDDIKDVQVYLSPRDHSSVGGGEPMATLERRRHPVGVVDAQFSVPYTVANVLVKRKLFIDDFSPEALKDPSVLAMADRVTPVPVPELGENDIDVKPAIVEIKTADGRLLTKRVDFPKGNALNPLSPQWIEQNFRECTRHAVKRLPEAQVEEAIVTIKSMEKLDNVRALTRLLVPQ